MKTELLDTFIVAVLFLFLNFILIAKRVPLLGIPVAIFTIFLTATKLITDTTIPLHFELGLFILIISMLNLFVNGLELNKK